MKPPAMGVSKTRDHLIELGVEYCSREWWFADQIDASLLMYGGAISSRCGWALVSHSPMDDGIYRRKELYALRVAEFSHWKNCGKKTSLEILRLQLKLVEADATAIRRAIKYVECKYETL